LILFLLLVGHLFAFFDFRGPLILFLLEQLVRFFHHLLGVIDALLSIVDRDQLVPNQAGVVLVAHVICVSWRHTLQIDNVTPLISSPDSLYLHATRNFNRFTLCIKYFVDLNTQFSRYFLHQCMELLIGLDRLLLIDCAVLCQARQLAVVQDTRDDALSNYSVASVVDYCRRDVVQAIHFEDLQLSEAREVVVCLRPTRILIRLCHVFEVIVGVNCVRKENQVVDEDLRFPLLSRIQRRDAALHDGCCSLCSCVQKVVVDLGYGSVSLSALGHVFLREILHNLVLLVPVANALGIEAKKWVDYLAELAL
jgi:hypothetical protein